MEETKNNTQLAGPSKKVDRAKINKESTDGTKERSSVKKVEEAMANDYKNYSDMYQSYGQINSNPAKGIKIKVDALPNYDDKLECVISTVKKEKSDRLCIETIENETFEYRNKFRIISKTYQGLEQDFSDLKSTADTLENLKTEAVDSFINKAADFTIDITPLLKEGNDLKVKVDELSKDLEKVKNNIRDFFISEIQNLNTGLAKIINTRSSMSAQVDEWKKKAVLVKKLIEEITDKTLEYRRVLNVISPKYEKFTLDFSDLKMIADRLEVLNLKELESFINKVNSFINGINPLLKDANDLKAKIDELSKKLKSVKNNISEFLIQEIQNLDTELTHIINDIASMVNQAAKWKEKAILLKQYIEEIMEAVPEYRKAFNKISSEHEKFKSDFSDLQKIADRLEYLKPEEVILFLNKANDFIIGITPVLKEADDLKVKVGELSKDLEKVKDNVNEYYILEIQSLDTGLSNIINNITSMINQVDEWIKKAGSLRPYIEELTTKALEYRKEFTVISNLYEEFTSNFSELKKTAEKLEILKPKELASFINKANSFITGINLLLKEANDLKVKIDELSKNLEMVKNNVSESLILEIQNLNTELTNIFNKISSMDNQVAKWKEKAILLKQHIPII